MVSEHSPRPCKYAVLIVICGKKSQLKARMFSQEFYPRPCSQPKLMGQCLPLIISQSRFTQNALDSILIHHCNSIFAHAVPTGSSFCKAAGCTRFSTGGAVSASPRLSLVNSVTQMSWMGGRSAEPIAFPNVRPQKEWKASWVLIIFRNSGYAKGSLFKMTPNKTHELSFLKVWG